MKKYFTIILVSFILMLSIFAGGCFAYVESVITEGLIRKSNLELINFEMKHYYKNYNLLECVPKVILILTVKNNTLKIIKTWRAHITIKNIFGDILFKSLVSGEFSNIEVNEDKKVRFLWDTDQLKIWKIPWMNDELYDKLIGCSKDNLKITITDVELIQ